MNPEEFGRFLEAIRGDMSLREASDKSGVSHTYIRNLEKGKLKNQKTVKASPETLKKLSIAYNYPYNDLMEKAGYLVGEQYILDLTGPNLGIRPQTDDEIVAEQKEKYKLMMNDIETMLFENQNISYRGVRLSIDDKQRIVDMLPILLRL